ncbi:MAG: methyltransferase domain-containing protein [SAR202 cluster bacterium]|jgi:arsenite methyltransferase|nr:MAG: methyltransferase domain-containing protein [SAR202 cluster bacterium]KAA1300573.1 MAG: methyltransferase domain-containing protein [SAR202 cluster bacterium]GIT17306.1 MAG: arsenite S-adenosylmethyltransferase [Dehalococcoidia bacterium]
MTDLNPLGTLVSTDEFASCCSGEVSGEITHAHLNSITEAVRHRYGALATTAAERALSSDKASDTFYTEGQRNVLTDETAGASAGCGNPVGIADAKPGETVLDLGSGGGIDCFIAAREVGHTGHVIGIDMTPEMLTLARDNAEKLRTNNVVFKLGHIESIPQSDNSVDLVISNCVIALSEKKSRVFSEIFRILKPGGRFVISDVVTEKPLPGDVRKSAAEWVDCVGGAAVMSEYIEMIADAGFLDVEVLEKQTRSSGAEAWRDLLINLTVRAFKKV